MKHDLILRFLLANYNSVTANCKYGLQEAYKGEDLYDAQEMTIENIYCYLC